MSRRILRWILALAPRGFRERYEQELLDVHDARAGRARGVAGAAFRLRELFGVATTVVRLRTGSASARGSAPTTGGGGSMFDDLRQDLRFALRGLRSQKGFTLTAVAVVALAVGANTAVFSAANSFFFRPLPFADADRLVALYETNPEFDWVDEVAAPANVLSWREQVDAFEDVAAYASFIDEVPWVQDGEPELLNSVPVTGNFFELLGVQAAVGRTFRWEETWQPDHQVVVLSHALWVSHFGADPSVVGRTLQFGSATREVVGVAPEGFAFPDSRVHLWSPEGWDPEARDAVWFRRAHWLRPIARLAPGVTVEEADAQLQVVVERLARDHPETNRVMGAGLAPLRSFLTRHVTTPLGVLVGASALLLLLACVNVANLFLVRGAGRAQEISLRYALGAGRGRVVRLLMVESAVISAVGAALGLALGWAGVGAMQGLTPLGIDGATSIALDGRVVGFVVAVATVCAVLFGVVPALQTSRDDTAGVLQESGGRGGAGRRASRSASLLVVAEVALAVVLVMGAGLTVRSVMLMRAVDPGFSPEGRLGVQINVPSSRYPDRDDVLAFYDRFIESLEGRAGVTRVGMAARLPLTGTTWSSQFQAEGWPAERVGLDITHKRADRGYFEAIGTPLLRGRLFERSDGPDAPLVVVINETFAREHFPGEDPIGQRIAYDRAAAQDPEGQNWREIVGVVADQHQIDPSTPPEDEVFEHAYQDWSRQMWFVVRSEGEPLDALPAVRSTLGELDPLVPIGDVRPLDEVWRASMADDEFLLTLLSAFGILALVLATVGVYGVTAQAARTRTREIGIRMALGAAGGAVVRMMLARGIRVVAVGLALGVAVTLATARVLASSLYGVEPNDPATLASVTLLLAAVATVASWIPARRATRVDPVDSLRAE